MVWTINVRQVKTLVLMKFTDQSPWADGQYYVSEATCNYYLDKNMPEANFKVDITTNVTVIYITVSSSIK